MEGASHRRGFSTEVLRLRTRDYGAPIQGRKKYSSGHKEFLDRLKRQPIVSAAAFFVMGVKLVEIPSRGGGMCREVRCPKRRNFLSPGLILKPLSKGVDR